MALTRCSMLQACLVAVDFLTNKSDDVGRHIGTIILEKTKYALCIEAAFSYQYRCCLVETTVLAIVNGSMGISHIGLPRQSTFSTATTFIIAKL